MSYDEVHSVVTKMFWTTKLFFNNLLIAFKNDDKYLMK